MDSRTVKQLSQVAFFGGIASILGSAAIYLLGQQNNMEGRRNAGVFVGLWAPTFFAISEMLDRIAEQDVTYLGVPVERGITTQTQPLTQGARNVVETARSLINR